MPTSTYARGMSVIEWIKTVPLEMGLFEFYKKYRDSTATTKLNFLEKLYWKWTNSKQLILEELADIRQPVLDQFPYNQYRTKEEAQKARAKNLDTEFDNSIEVISLLTEPYYSNKIEVSDQLREMFQSASGQQIDIATHGIEEQETGYCTSCESNPCVCSDPKYSSIDEFNILN